MPSSRENLVIESGQSMASRIHDNLWMGNAPPVGDSVARHFQGLVLSAKEYQPVECFFGLEVMGVPLNDDGTPMTPKEKTLAVKAAGRVIRWLNDGKSVLVTCWAGRNRSGIIAALALCRGPAGLTPTAAVKMIRKARGDHAMRNEYFLRFLYGYCGSNSARSGIRSR